MNRDFEVDLENGGMVCEEDTRKSPDLGVKKQAKDLMNKAYDRFLDGSIKGDEEKVGSCCHSPESKNGVSMESASPLACHHNKSEEKKTKEKPKSLSNKKSPKPPRPPRGPSLDAADHKLIREIAELAMLKRARTERMRALKKIKASKASSSSNGNLFAMVFTLLFCLVIIFQGMPPRAASQSFQGSPMSPGGSESGLISVEFVGNPSASEPNGAYSGSPHLVERVSGLDTEEKLKRVGR